jgi:hypothetical protein
MQGTVVALCLAIVTACGTPSTASPPVPGSGGPAASGSPTAGHSTTPSDEPDLSAEPSVATSLEPEVSPSSSLPASAHSAVDCTGNDKNRDFFADIAVSVSWTVYCAVLPDGWVVDAGSYRLASGGKLDIGYRNRAGARLELHEGAFCSDLAGCSPPGSEIGEAPFGDRTGTLISAEDGSWALVVDAGKAVSWLAIGRSLDDESFRGLAADLIRVGD